METVQQDAFAMKELLDEDGDGLTGLARTLLEAGVNEMMAAQADAMCEATGTAGNGFCVLSTRFEQNEHRNLSSLRTRRAQAF